MRRAARAAILGTALFVVNATVAQARAETCLAIKTSVKDDPASGFTAEDLPLEKSFIQDGELKRTQYLLKNSEGSPFFLSATIEAVTQGATLIIKDNQTQVSSGVTGSFGNDGSISTNLGFSVQGRQQVVTLTCTRDTGRVSSVITSSGASTDAGDKSSHESTKDSGIVPASAKTPHGRAHGTGTGASTSMNTSTQGVSTEASFSDAATMAAANSKSGRTASSTSNAMAIAPAATPATKSTSPPSPAESTIGNSGPNQ